MPKPPSAHVIAAADRGRIKCTRCDAPASMVEHCPLYTGSVAFYQYCADCWLAPAANGGPSAAERTGVDLSREDDLERLWLAECRAHGETRRKLEAALARLEASDRHAPKGGWAAQPAKMARRVRRAVTDDMAHMAREHESDCMHSLAQPPEPEREDDGESDDAWTGGFAENH